MLTALPEATINLVDNFVEAPLPADPYTQLRARLLAAHQLTDYQKLDFIKKMPSLGAQKPSELFAEMLRVCPRGREGNIFFPQVPQPPSQGSPFDAVEDGLCGPTGASG